MLDSQQEQTLGFAVLYRGDAAAFLGWLREHTEGRGVGETAFSLFAHRL